MQFPVIANSSRLPIAAVVFRDRDPAVASWAHPVDSRAARRSQPGHPRRQAGLTHPVAAAPTTPHRSHGSRKSQRGPPAPELNNSDAHFAVVHRRSEPHVSAQRCGWNDGAARSSVVWAAGAARARVPLGRGGCLGAGVVSGAGAAWPRALSRARVLPGRGYCLGAGGPRGSRCTQAQKSPLAWHHR
jgi:hypothetical protein